MSAVALHKFSFFIKFNKTVKARCLFSRNHFCSSGVLSKKKREDYFFDQKVHNILKKITGLDYEKIFRPKPTELTPHKYEFVTDKQLKEMKEVTKKRAYEKLQMPPVMDIREPIDQVLSKDPELQGYLETRLIFTDTSFSKNSRNRIITVRETDGTLRKANWDERFRMNQIFFPLEGRSLETPKLFESPQLDKLLVEGSYEFVLDSACVQFEPDDPEYHRVTSITYEHVKSTKSFDTLRSTRHFGPMAFYFAYSKNIDELLVDMVDKKLIEDAADTVKLLYILHPDLEVSPSNKTDDLEYLQEYVQNNKSPTTAHLELALQSYLEIVQSTEKENVSL